MIEHDKIKYVLDNIVKKDYNYPLAHQILDYFESQATTVDDYNVLGELSVRAKHYALRLRAAEFVYTHAKTTEDLYLARENLIQIHNALNQPEQALYYVNLNLAVNPNDVDMLQYKAFNLSLMNRKEESEQILLGLVAGTDKQRENLEYALSGRQLRMGDTAKGIKNFITKFKPKNPLFEDQLKLKFWDGGVHPGKTIVVNGEGGIGDEIINIRFFQWFERMGMTPILYSSWAKFRPDIVNLFRRHGYRVETNYMFFKKDWLWTHMMALPGYMGLTEDQLWTGPYLQPLRQSKNQLNDSNFKVGIKCNGNPYFDQDIYRRIPIDEMLQVLPKNVSVYYIDKEKTHPDCKNLGDRLETWEDTLDFIDQMDVIFSSCTSLVHAAGAMGKRTIVIVPIAEYYVWTSTRTDGTTPWYADNLKIFRQVKPRDWQEPLAEAGKLIKQYLNQP